jgi:LmbE family N-acetylglucosaminyl deacetylase
MSALSGIDRVLVLAPHTDDGEFGCGATIARLSAKGADVTYVAFSAAEQSVLPHLPADILRTEVYQATERLGIGKDRCIVLDYQVRQFPSNRQRILEELVSLNTRLNPQIVFLPSPTDTHQDHSVIAAEGFRAFKRCSMLGYEVPWNNLDFRTSCFIEISEQHLSSKVDALSMYRSQAHRAYASADFIRSLATVRGVQIGKRYAESFEVIRWVL